MRKKAFDLAFIFQEMMTDILRRRAVIETMEIMGMRKMRGEIETRIREDYLRVQLEDLRKFFDRSDSAHRMIDLIEMTGDREIKELHKNLFSIWRKKYQDLANKLYFHLDRSRPAYEDVTHDGLNSFIDSARTLLERIFANLKKSRKIQKRMLTDFEEYKYEKIDAAIFFKVIGDHYPAPPMRMGDLSVFLGLGGRSAKKMYCGKHHKLDAC